MLAFLVWIICVSHLMISMNFKVGEESKFACDNVGEES